MGAQLFIANWVSGTLEKGLLQLAFSRIKLYL